MTPAEQKEFAELKALVASIVKSDRFYINPAVLELRDGVKVQLGLGTGTQFGTSVSQKMAWFGATPLIQQTGAGVITGHFPNAGTDVTDASRFTGNVGSAGFTIGDIVAILKKYGFIASS